MTSRRSSSATSSRLDQHPEVRKKALSVNSFALKIFPFFSVLQRSTFSYRAITYITLLFAIIQHILISVFPNLYANYQIDQIIASIFLFSYPSYNTTHITLEIIVIAVGYVALFFFIATVIRYKLKGTITKVEIAAMNIIMHFFIPLVILPLSSNAGSILTAMINQLASTLSTIVLLLLTFILWACFIGIFYFSTLFSSSTIFFHDSVCVYFESKPIFFTYLFNSFLAFLIWISKDFNVNFPYFVGALNIVLDLFLLFLIFNFPFAYLYVTTIAAATLTSCIFGSIGFFIGGNLGYLRYVLVLVSFLISSIVFHIILKFVSKKIIRKEEFVNDRLAIKQLRLAVSQNDPSFISGKIIEMIVQGTNNYTVRLEVAKFVCYFQELQPQFTAQLAMLRNATSLSMSESFLFYQLRIAETGRQPLCTVDELMPLRDETKKLEMTIRAAWKYIQNNNDFFAPSIMEPINRQKEDCMGH
ncbi:hypothetical protein TVAG_294970 [Trichomonas vaginalis G3]|uniref:Uncharacterized protein n=1 Tax=Trichomonas vaginalis (strain ATCC PRA-98 / G3) TaxID=412133 RepID=A2DL54_TRIV3|nr:hypothetical protein TVAGG3_0273680 [Trichomonas vaginalis G3]EAY18845.1 hypothetical protein TVAG_294970 [Trichomonas vaginalis G3]KAI5526049.1 hypothetical protein TVAGG3_0273680 [Trichomonas vaginalis G3]|eukprot:XP_001579831.1 hypothetical protein [Trichomonas vaginalis G3]